MNLQERIERDIERLSIKYEMPVERVRRDYEKAWGTYWTVMKEPAELHQEILKVLKDWYA